MFLKRITVNGFKSFADRVDFDFGPGITCIVGPNGCGKSNVVDAFKWVLGEQSARSLRGRQMQDMIFNGSSARRASSVAQVDLVFDNADRALPVDQPEVTVTRKLYRSGESEYMLNKESVRLKDVRELFMDTGVGVNAYSVIEQGKVDLLLQSSPVDRRVIFEEAAGISKYKARKKEAQRKLDRAEQNLLRVGDVVEELERRLRSVKLAAGKARRYQEYQTRLNELKSSFALAEYHRFLNDIARLEGEVEAQGDKTTELRTLIDRYEAEGAEATVRLDQLAEEISQADNNLVQARSTLAAQEERAQAADDRAAEQQETLGRATKRLSGDTERAAVARRQSEEVRETETALQGQLSTLDASIDEHAASDQTLVADITAAKALVEDVKSGIIELLRQSAQTHNEIVRLSTRRESLVSEQGRLSMRDAQITSELEGLLEQKANLQRRLNDVDGLVHREKQTLDEKKRQAVEADRRVEELTSEVNELRTERSALSSRQELLQDLERNMEGVDAGARKLLDEKVSSETDGYDWIVGLVADVFETDVANAGVIEAALGGKARHLVVTHGDALRNYVELEQELPGRVTAIALDRLGPLVNPRDFSERPGFVACAADLVRGPGQYDDLKRHLFGKVIVTDNLACAMEMASTDTAGHRFVTRNGDLVEQGGARISVGRSASGTGLISRKSELRELADRLYAIEHTSADVAVRLEESQADARHLEELQRTLQDAVYKLSTDKVEANAALQNIVEAVNRLTHEQPVIAQQATVIEQEINEVLEKGAEGGRSLEAIERENTQREAEVAQHDARIGELVSRRAHAQEVLTGEKVQRGQLAEKRRAVRDQAESLSRTLQELDESLEAAKRDIEQCQRSIVESQQTASESRRQVEQLASKMGELEGIGSRLRNERESLKVEMDGRMNAIKTARGQLGVVEESQHESELSLAQVRVRKEELLSRVAAELDTDLAQLYDDYEHADDRDWIAVEEEIDDLRGKMDRLGNVNLDAITELAELEERYLFLTTQRDDLMSSRKQLEQLIERLNHESEERFKKAFEEIRENFRALFRKLFGGGRADVVLEDPEDILDCGIEIVAQPPGKDLQVISLMSGGEKSMTAIALVMSIFQLRAAPFVLMDEVDAALDEANNDRFNLIVQEFVKKTQFIIITHSKWTMNIGEHLYGVTMHEAGVSTRVGVELHDAHVA